MNAAAQLNVPANGFKRGELVITSAARAVVDSVGPNIKPHKNGTYSLTQILTRMHEELPAKLFVRRGSEGMVEVKHNGVLWQKLLGNEALANTEWLFKRTVPGKHNEFYAKGDVGGFITFQKDTDAVDGVSKSTATFK